MDMCPWGFTMLWGSRGRMSPQSECGLGYSHEPPALDQLAGQTQPQLSVSPLRPGLPGTAMSPWPPWPTLQPLPSKGAAYPLE